MADRIVYGCAETGTYLTTAPDPHVDLSGGAADGYGIKQLFSVALTNTETCTVTVRQGESVWAVYGGAVFTTGSPNSLDFSSATLLESAGTITSGSTVTVLGLFPDYRQYPTVYTPAIAAGLLELDLHGERETYHRVTLNADVQSSPTAGITLANPPADGVVRISVELHRTSDTYDCPELAWGGIPGIVFDTDYYLYPTATGTPTVVTLLSTDGGTSFRARNNGPAEAAGFATLAELNAILVDATLIDTTDSRLSDARTPTAHTSSHKHGGADEVATATAGANAIPKAGSGGTLGTGWIPDLSATYATAAKGVTNGDSHDHSGGDGAQIAYANLSGTPSLGGAAALNVGTTTGTVAAGDDSRLSDARTPTAHAASHQSAGGDAIKLDDLAAPDDNTDLNASASVHGLLPKLSNVSTQYLNGIGGWTTPAGGGGGTDSGLVIVEASSIGGAMTCTFTENTSF